MPSAGIHSVSTKWSIYIIGQSFEFLAVPFERTIVVTLANVSFARCETLPSTSGGIVYVIFGDYAFKMWRLIELIEYLDAR